MWFCPILSSESSLMRDLYQNLTSSPLTVISRRPLVSLGRSENAKHAYPLNLSYLKLFTGVLLMQFLPHIENNAIERSNLICNHWISLAFLWYPARLAVTGCIFIARLYLLSWLATCLLPPRRVGVPREMCRWLGAACESLKAEFHYSRLCFCHENIRAFIFTPVSLMASQQRSLGSLARHF